jgi:hypothetical protein
MDEGQNKHSLERNAVHDFMEKPHTTFEHSLSLYRLRLCLYNLGLSLYRHSLCLKDFFGGLKKKMYLCGQSGEEHII